MLTVIPCYSLAEGLLLNKVFPFRVCFKSTKVALKARVCVWVAMSDINGIVVI
jgi:hypothetical protein